MANFKDQLNIAKKLNDLTRQRIQDEKFMDTTLDSRVEILNRIVQNKQDINKLSDIESEIEQKIAGHIETGHTALADKYKIELKLVQIKKKELTAQQNINDAMSEAGDTLLGGMITKAKDLTEQLKKPGGVLVVGLAAAVALMVSFAKQTDEIGQKFGAIGVKEFAQDLREANVTAVGLGRGLDDVASTLQTMSDNFGVSTKNSAELLSSITKTSVSLGLSNEEGATLIGTLKTISGLSDDQATSLAKQTALLAKQEGLVPSTVMKDVAGSSETIAKFTKEGGKNIAVAAVQARKLGVNLDTAAKISEGLLDFESSIEKSLEASVMIGRQLNFDAARRLAFEGKIAEATKAVVEQLGSEAEFNRLNPLARQALADSIGVSTAELAKFVRLQGKSTSEMMALESMKIDELVPQEAISNITLLNNKIKQIGASIMSAIGGFTKFIGITGDSSIGADILKLGLIALAGGLVFLGISALATALKIKLTSKILGTSGTGFAAFGASAAAAIPILLTIAAVALSVGFGFKMMATGLVAILDKLSVGGILQISALSLALTGLSAALIAVGVAGLVALPTLAAVAATAGIVGGAALMFGGGGEDTKEVHDKILEEQVGELKEEMSILRREMKSYFGIGGIAYTEFGRSTQTALENAS